MRRAQQGEPEAFEQLYEAHFNKIYRYIVLRVRNQEEAEDLTQQVFLKAWKAIRKYKKTATPFLAWLMRITHNLVVDFYRSKKDTAFLDNELVLEDKTPGPEQLAEEHFNQQQIRKVILQLPEEQQQVVLMSFIEVLRLIRN